MPQNFHEAVLGEVLVAPFVIQAGGALVILVLLRPLLRRAGFESLFSAPPAALLCLYVLIVALLVAAI